VSSEKVSASNSESFLSSEEPAKDSKEGKEEKLKSHDFEKQRGFSPIMNRNDIAGRDDELSGIEEFYLIEIE
jgi:hypothetical protein